MKTVTTSAQDAPVKNIVLVHGAFVDGSGWQGVFQILSKKGYQVSVVQIPLTSLQDDVDTTNRVLDKQDGPVILVGHSWGGFVITEAGMHEKVAGLVYVAALQPEVGENTIQLSTALPAAPENGVMEPDDKGFVYYDKAKFHAGFGADLSTEQAEFLYASQKPIAVQSFGASVTNASWKIKPSYGIVALNDKTINPVTERWMYKRSNSRITEIESSHVVFITHPDEVAQVIINAADKK
jgi:pimeloyl-ACP methyl ester carboxylesterase